MIPWRSNYHLLHLQNYDPQTDQDLKSMSIQPKILTLLLHLNFKTKYKLFSFLILLSSYEVVLHFHFLEISFSLCLSFILLSLLVDLFLILFQIPFDLCNKPVFVFLEEHAVINISLLGLLNGLLHYGLWILSNLLANRNLLDYLREVFAEEIGVVKITAVSLESFFWHHNTQILILLNNKIL